MPEHFHHSPASFNRIIKSSIGKTAKEYIQAQSSTAAKTILFFSDLSNKEIDLIGLVSPANFSAFFKKMHRLPPLLIQK